MSGFKQLSAFVDVPCEWVCVPAYDSETDKLREQIEGGDSMSVLDEIRPEWDALVESVNELIKERDELRALCRDMYLIVGVLDARGARLQLHGKLADWRTLEERYEALMGEDS